MANTVFMNKLARLRATNCAELPTPEIAILVRTIARLRQQGLHVNCLQVGETVPDFELHGSNLSFRTLYEALEQGPAVINFFRGLWCQYCKTELEAYENIQSDLDQLGCSYFAISPQKPEMPETRLKNYQAMWDADNTLAKQFGIVYQMDPAEQNLFASWGLKLDQVNGTTHWELPVPATFVVCKDRTIGYQFVDVDFRARCCPEQLLFELRSFCDCD